MVAITTIIPAYNAETFLGEAIGSVLNQSRKVELELLVIDDGSTDGTQAVAESFEQVTYIRQENAGAAAARNHGLRRSSHELICFLDADDKFTSDKFELQISAMERDTADAIFGHVAEFVSGAALNQRAPSIGPARLPSTMMIKKDFANRIGFFDETLRVGEFVDWYARAMNLGINSIMLDQIVLYRRLHQNNMGLRESASFGDYAKVLKAHLDRRQRAT